MAGRQPVLLLVRSIDRLQYMLLNHSSPQTHTTQTGIKTLENAPESKRANEKQPATLNIKCLDCSEEGTWQCM